MVTAMIDRPAIQCEVCKTRYEPTYADGVVSCPECHAEVIVDVTVPRGVTAYHPNMDQLREKWRDQARRSMFEQYG
jgi:DNA-directed RNA polymerase subunit RPC12/RpoP